MNRTIILMRHGQPQLDEFGKLSALDMKDWIEHYNQSGITRQPAPMPASNSPQPPR